MPASDLKLMEPLYLATLTVSRVRKRLTRWSNIPWDIFLEFVVPYAVLSEPRDTTLEFLHDFEAYLNHHTPEDASLSEIALILNQKAFAYTDPPIKFEGAPPNKVNAYSPSEVVKAKAASCTGESVFLVYALRLVGVPARVAGVPHWDRGIRICKCFLV